MIFSNIDIFLLNISVHRYYIFRFILKQDIDTLCSSAHPYAEFFARDSGLQNDSDVILFENNDSDKLAKLCDNLFDILREQRKYRYLRRM